MLAAIRNRLFSRGRYNDVLLFMVLIPFINALNYYLTYPKIEFTSYTLITFIIDTLTGYVEWWIIRSIIIYLDQKMPYGEKPLKRILIQLVSTTIAGLLVIILITETVNRLLADHPVPASFYQFDIFIFIIWIFFVNGIYIAWYYFMEWSISESIRKKEKAIRKTGFQVTQGKQQISLPFEEISCLYVEGEYVILSSTGGKKYFLSQSLDNCENLLPEEWFFRLNRQFIVHRQSIKGFNKVENSKLEVLTQGIPGITTPILVSRTRASSFKNWFQRD